MPAAKKNSKGSENGTWKCLSKQIPEFVPTRIESKGTGSGIADVWAGDCAIELKQEKNYPVKEDQPFRMEHPLSIAQYRWLNDRWDNGFKSFVLVQVRIKHFHLFCAPDSHILVHGREVSRMRWFRYNFWYADNGIAESAANTTINEQLRMSFEQLQNDREFIMGMNMERVRI